MWRNFDLRQTHYLTHPPPLPSKLRRLLPSMCFSSGWRTTTTTLCIAAGSARQAGWMWRSRLFARTDPSKSRRWRYARFGLPGRTLLLAWRLSVVLTITMPHVPLPGLGAVAARRPPKHPASHQLAHHSRNSGEAFVIPSLFWANPCKSACVDFHVIFHPSSFIVPPLRHYA